MTAAPEALEPEVARRKLVAAARRVNRMWALTVFGSAAFCLFWVLLGVAACVAGEWVVGAICLVPAIPLGYNVARFLPRTPEVPRSWFAPSVEDEQLLQDWLAAHAGGWRPEVALAADVRVEVVDGQLVLGLPLIACLRVEEIAVLVKDARDLHEPDSHPAVARADGLVRRGVPGRHLALQRAREAWAQAVRSRHDDRWQRAVAAATTVDEAQQILQQWLDPALEQGLWHADALSALRDFLDGWESVGADVWGGPRLGPNDARDALPVIAAYEREIIERTLRGVPHETEPISWDDHARVVDVAVWRRQLSTGLEAAERATGTTQPATLDAVLTLLDEGWGASIAAVLVPATPRMWSPTTRSRRGSPRSRSRHRRRSRRCCCGRPWLWPSPTLGSPRPSGPGRTAPCSWTARPTRSTSGHWRSTPSRARPASPTNWPVYAPCWRLRGST